MFWVIVNSLAFVGTPVGLVWGWVGWAKRRRDQTRVRGTMSLVAISMATVTLIVFLAARFLGTPKSQTLDRVGLYLAAASIVVSLAGRLRLMIPVCLVSTGAIMIWFGTTLP
jgi:hypothetical protein